jgi:hypothetical protein
MGDAVLACEDRAIVRPSAVADLLSGHMSWVLARTGHGGAAQDVRKQSLYEGAGSITIS